MDEFDMTEAKESKEQVINCPHCGNRAPHLLHSTITTMERVFDSDGSFVGDYENYHFSVECLTCNHVSLLGNWEIDDHPFDLNSAVLLYPSVKKFTSSDSPVPTNVARNYEEARKVKKVSPLAFTVLLRRTLECIVNDKNTEGGNLVEKIGKLTKSGILPPTLSQMSDSLRFLGNMASHPTDIEIDDNDATLLDDFIVTLIEYLYIAPEKLKKLQTKLQGKKNKLSELDSSSGDIVQTIT